MRIAVIGAGGVGGMLAARLGAAGHEISLLARGSHLAAIREAGLRLVTPAETVELRPAVVSDRGEDLPEADLVIVAVKAQDLDGAADQMARAMAGGAPALPFLNGVEATDRLAARFGADRVLIGIARISAHIEAPGVVRQVTPGATYTIGTAAGRQDDEQVREIRATFHAAGITVPESADVRVDLWTKFAALSAFSGVTAGARCTAGALKTTPALEALYLRLAGEVTELGRAEGIALRDDLPRRMLDFARGLPDEMRASLAHDLDAGKALEIDWLAGAVPRLGARHGLAAPASETVAALLEPWKHGARGGGK
ncbi:2-dehydropantoate 2-reductase [Limibaculum sp. M0105]|uniref:2-dehydropantoate 2-reductase n=1 Tax=Thermohalobaculum xanthum TaxID=2753746 RepID=A0A8J7SC95_9RHOB|nr:2-dehydropantoate 2-reductase [Thermohalobaculum xanthum]MBK0398563.1 2-dehydropantoate 2-reductase [Thermohalobaculum xanthum]